MNQKHQGVEAPGVVLCANESSQDLTQMCETVMISVPLLKLSATLNLTEEKKRMYGKIDTVHNWNHLH